MALVRRQSLGMHPSSVRSNPPLVSFFAVGYRPIMKRSMKRSKMRKRYHLPVLIEQDEDGVFIVSVPTLRGCRSYGDTLDQAMDNITEAAALCLEDEKPASGAVFVGLRDLEIIA